MAINARTDTLIPVKSIRSYLTKPPSGSTIWRWYNYGVRNRVTGKLVFLETIKRGDRRFTTAAAIERFFEECSADE